MSQQAQNQPQLPQVPQQFSKEQLLQQVQLFQRLQQMQLIPQNFNLLRYVLYLKVNLTNDFYFMHVIHL